MKKIVLLGMFFITQSSMATVSSAYNKAIDKLNAISNMEIEKKQEKFNQQPVSEEIKKVEEASNFSGLIKVNDSLKTEISNLKEGEEVNCYTGKENSHPICQIMASKDKDDSSKLVMKKLSKRSFEYQMLKDVHYMIKDSKSLGSQKNILEKIETLKKKGLDIFTIIDGEDILSLSIKNKRKSLVKFLTGKDFDHSKNIKKVYGVNKNSIIHLAVESNSSYILSKLMLSKFPINMKNNEGNSPLHLAIEKNRLMMLDILIPAAATLSIKNKKGETEKKLLQTKKLTERYKKYLNKSLKKNKKSEKYFSIRTKVIKEKLEENRAKREEIARQSQIRSQIEQKDSQEKENQLNSKINDILD